MPTGTFAAPAPPVSTLLRVGSSPISPPSIGIDALCLPFARGGVEPSRNRAGAFGSYGGSVRRKEAETRPWRAQSARSLEIPRPRQPQAEGWAIPLPPFNTRVTTHGR